MPPLISLRPGEDNASQAPRQESVRRTGAGIVIVDYGMGNLRSVQKAFEAAGAAARVTDSAREIRQAEKIVVPGVGAFSHAMKELQKRKLVGVLKEKIADGTPYLGLCLGLQILFAGSEEGPKTRGLGVVGGCVVRFRGKLKVPHMGWNTLDFKKDSPLTRGLKSGGFFYFVHSYYAVPEDAKDVLATTRYGINFCSALQKGNIFATQFHPEKSQSAGLALIRNFLK